MQHCVIREYRGFDFYVLRKLHASLNVDARTIVLIV